MKQKQEPIRYQGNKPRLKYIKKARMFCRTSWEGTKQIQEWLNRDEIMDFIQNSQ